MLGIGRAGGPDYGAPICMRGRAEALGSGHVAHS